MNLNLICICRTREMRIHLQNYFSIQFHCSPSYLCSATVFRIFSECMKRCFGSRFYLNVFFWVYLPSKCLFLLIFWMYPKAFRLGKHIKIQILDVNLFVRSLDLSSSNMSLKTGDESSEISEWRHQIIKLNKNLDNVLANKDPIRMSSKHFSSNLKK